MRTRGKARNNPQNQPPIKHQPQQQTAEVNEHSGMLHPLTQRLSWHIAAVQEKATHFFYST